MQIHIKFNQYLYRNLYFFFAVKYNFIRVLNGTENKKMTIFHSNYEKYSGILRR